MIHTRGGCNANPMGARMSPIRQRNKGGDQEYVFAGSDEDKPLQAVLKWIPVEVIGAYQVAVGVVPSNRPAVTALLAIVFVVLSGAWIAFATADDASKNLIAWRQVVLATIAFALWILGTQPEVIKYAVSNWENWMGSVVLGLGWLLLPIADGILRRMHVPQD
jgi:hypothetical protein